MYNCYDCEIATYDCETGVCLSIVILSDRRWHIMENSIAVKNIQSSMNKIVHTTPSNLSELRANPNPKLSEYALRTIPQITITNVYAFLNCYSGRSDRLTAFHRYSRLLYTLSGLRFLRCNCQRSRSMIYHDLFL